MNRTQSIKQKCLNCAGDSPKEVTLCHIVDCPLWTFRFGYSMKDNRYKMRMESAKIRYPEIYKEMLLALSDYIENTPNLPEIVHIRAFLEKKVA